MAAYELPEPVYDKEAGETVFPPPAFDRSAIFQGARHAGRFYYIVYDTDALQDRSLLRALGEKRTTVLTYREPEPFVEYETVCLRTLKEVRRDD